MREKITHPKYKLDELTASRILGNVFEACGKEPNTIPLEALSSYAVYRKERFSLQRAVIIGAMILFLALPFLFVLPKVKITQEEEGIRGLPVYTITVSALLPERSVTAGLQSHMLPVYEADAGSYTVEPTRNGTMTVSVELVNRQKITQNVPIKDVDAHGPVLTGSRTGEGRLFLYLEDEGIGIDYRDTLARTASGKLIRPESWNEDLGEIVFSYPEEPWDVYIPDYIGNTLHLALTFQTDDPQS